MTEKRKPGRPSGTKRVDPETAIEQRATFIVRKDLLSKIKKIAEAESLRVSIENNQEITVKFKIIVNKAFEEYISRYEEKYGEL